jgi:hypothetical protein
MRKIIVVGGYARSGKSTSIKIIESFGIPTTSTSVILDNILDSLVPYLKDWVPSILESENDPIYKNIRRKKKIWLAEQIICKKLTRQSLVFGVIKKIKETNSKIIVVESIGGEEYNLLMEQLYHLSEEFLIKNVNIRRKTEEPGIDIRELLPNSVDIWNESTLEDLEFCLNCLINN